MSLGPPAGLMYAHSATCESLVASGGCAIAGCKSLNCKAWIHNSAVDSGTAYSRCRRRHRRHRRSHSEHPRSPPPASTKTCCCSVCVAVAPPPAPRQPPLLHYYLVILRMGSEGLTRYSATPPGSARSVYRSLSFSASLLQRQGATAAGMKAAAAGFLQRRRQGCRGRVRQQ